MTTRLSHRAVIRHYIHDMISEKVGVPNVFTCRGESPLFPDELPAVVISYGEEQTDVTAGSQNLVKSYVKTLDVNFTIVVQNQVAPSETPYSVTRSSDFIDGLCEQIEECFRDDWQLARRLEGFDPDNNYDGLVNGNRLVTTLVFDVETDSGSAFISASLKYAIPYWSSGCPGRRYRDFEIGTIEMKQ